MNRGRHSEGYTIVETLIFLAVSGALFVSAMAAISGRQGRTEFTNAAREFEVKIQDIANDVSTGYYANPAIGNNFLRCNGSGPNLVVTPSSSTDRQGSNQGCIFIGKTLQLGINGATDQYNVMTLAGKRQTTSNVDVSNFTESTVHPIVNPVSPVDITETGIYPPFTFVCTLYATTPITLSATNPCTSGGVTRTDNLTFLTTFVGINAATQNRDSDDTKVDLLVHPPTTSSTATGRSKAVVAGEIERYGTVSTAFNPAPISPTVNPAGGVYICLNSNGSRQYALLRIGGQGSRFSTDLKIENGRCE